MSKLDELIEWHEKHATYYTDSAVLQQTHRDTAEALRLCRDYIEATEKILIVENTEPGDTGYPVPDVLLNIHASVADDNNYVDALAALRDAGLIERGG